MIDIGVSGIERGSFNPTVYVLDRLAAALGIDVADLLALPDTTAGEPKPMRSGRRSAHR